jgi:hypothetical protein
MLMMRGKDRRRLGGANENSRQKKTDPDIGIHTYTANKAKLDLGEIPMKTRDAPDSTQFTGGLENEVRYAGFSGTGVAQLGCPMG